VLHVCDKGICSQDIIVGVSRDVVIDARSAERGGERRTAWVSTCMEGAAASPFSMLGLNAVHHAAPINITTDVTEKYSTYGVEHEDVFEKKPEGDRTRRFRRHGND
jgi:hypothetical protein